MVDDRKQKYIENVRPPEGDKIKAKKVTLWKTSGEMRKKTAHRHYLKK